MAHGVGTPPSANGASNVTLTTLSDTTTNGTRAGDVDHSIANPLVEIDRLEAAVAAGKGTST